MKRCVIIGGAPIADYEKIKEYLRADDFYICCDCGLDHAEGLGITPDLIVGDFDSHKKPETDIETITLPREKDDTDTYFAAKEGIRRGFELTNNFVNVLSAEVDKYACKTYEHIFGDNPFIDYDFISIISDTFYRTIIPICYC